jgi:hypothetical protein
LSLYRHLVVWASILALAGCAGAPQKSVEAREVIELLDDYGHLVAMPADDQLRAYQEAQTNFEQQPGDQQRLRLALVLTLPRAPWRDDARVLQLIESIAEAPVDKISPHRDFALVLQKLINERLRLLREDQRKAEDAQQKLQNQLAERQRQLREEHRKVEVLQEKVDALRTIDRDTHLKMQRR